MSDSKVIKPVKRKLNIDKCFHCGGRVIIQDDQESFLCLRSGDLFYVKWANVGSHQVDISIKEGK